MDEFGQPTPTTERKPAAYTGVTDTRRAAQARANLKERKPRNFLRGGEINHVINKAIYRFGFYQ